MLAQTREHCFIEPTERALVDSGSKPGQLAQGHTLIEEETIVIIE